ncbi:MAG TPA: DUF4350 domain-containing protein [Pyrinomonadaceae bacterium]|nr:DUF4350 domain-containing protein [Pyrinomonadaceae bacterium]
MRQRLAIILTVAVVLVLLVGLNAASYVSVKNVPDSEFNPDRSTYNAGATGTRALYDLLADSGRRVMRWREQPAALLNTSGDKAPATFVIIGKTRSPFDEEEAESIKKWVERGGRLVIIDRRPDARLLPPSENWRVSTGAHELPGSSVNPAKPEEMTAGVALVRASQPTVLTLNVEAVLPSRYAGTINISEVNAAPVAKASPSPPINTIHDDGEQPYESDEEPPPPPPASSPRDMDRSPARPEAFNQTLTSPAPIAHLENYRGAMLVDYPHGAGRIVVLSEPYMVANGGIKLADNLQLALNVIAGGGGLIAFDEYHQARAASSNHLLAYFSGTPVVWMFAQGALVVLAVLWTRGRRFARPLPMPFVDRRSSLEFVASMAELQQRARAYDLAIENIYTRLRRVLVRYAGLSHNSPRSEVAARVAARSAGKLDAANLESLMRECEDAIQGTPVDGRKALELVTRLREVERALGLRMRSREARQAAEGLQQNTLL